MYSSRKCHPKINYYIIVDTKSEKLNKIGPCVNNLCPAEYKCLNNECIKNQISLKNLTEG